MKHLILPLALLFVHAASASAATPCHRICYPAEKVFPVTAGYGEVGDCDVEGRKEFVNDVAPSSCRSGRAQRVSDYKIGKANYYHFRRCDGVDQFGNELCYIEVQCSQPVTAQFRCL